ncbi:MAG TPA: CHASE3 domain-containing protein [Devosiaceae bacterium]|jgi:two-component sensor histidine kinase/CHASE3 domain sensor protein|nr:CHASE3 domain-containing protein [Devosiaceae bacterium]
MTDLTTQLAVPAAPRRRAGRWLLIVLSLFLVLAAAGSALVVVRGADAQLADIARTYEVRRHARDLIQALVDAESGQRGYLLTQDQAYLEPYEAAVASIGATYARLLDLVSGEVQKVSILSGLEESIEHKRSEMATTITLAASDRLDEALVILRSDAGRALMDQLRGTLRSFIAAEDAMLVERNAAVELSRQLLVGAILIALGGAATLTYLVFTLTQRQVSILAEASTALQSQNEELEAHVRARTKDAEEARAHAERERARVEALLQDTNHRIGNSLATVSSLLGLQVTRTQSPEVRAALEAAQNRVHAIASGHRRLRLGDDMETTNAAEFLAAVVEDLGHTQSPGRQVGIHCDLEPLIISARDATTIGIVVGELITNALKHAFPDQRPGQIRVQLSQDDAGATILSVEDDGCGMPPSAASGHAGLGAMIISQLVRQFNGEAHYRQREGGGTSVQVTLPGLTQPIKA